MFLYKCLVFALFLLIYLAPLTALPIERDPDAELYAHQLAATIHAQERVMEQLINEQRKNYRIEERIARREAKERRKKENEYIKRRRVVMTNEEERDLREHLEELMEHQKKNHKQRKTLKKEMEGLLKLGGAKYVPSKTDEEVQKDEEEEEKNNRREEKKRQIEERKKELQKKREKLEKEKRRQEKKQRQLDGCTVVKRYHGFTLSDSNKIGEGSEGIIYKVHDDEEWRALKLMKDCDTPAVEQRARSQCSISRVLDHECLVKLEALFIYTQNSTRKCAFLMDLVDDAKDVKKLGKTPDAWKYAERIMSAVTHIYDHNMMFHDLNLKNVMINTKTKKVSIIDYGAVMKFTQRTKRLNYEEKMHAREITPPEMGVEKLSTTKTVKKVKVLEPPYSSVDVFAACVLTTSMVSHPIVDDSDEDKAYLKLWRLYTKTPFEKHETQFKPSTKQQSLKGFMDLYNVNKEQASVLYDMCHWLPKKRAFPGALTTRLLEIANNKGKGKSKGGNAKKGSKKKAGGAKKGKPTKKKTAKGKKSTKKTKK